MANEKRLISYDVLMEHLDSCIKESKGLFKSVCVAVKCFAEQMPTVDAVEKVVRCKDCRHCIHMSKKYKCDIACEKLHTDSIYLDFYCRYGERKAK